jgi:hypothetical protein
VTEIAGIEIPVTSRFSIHEKPINAPGVCCVCKHPGGGDRFFVDFGFQLDWYGAVYFCSECIIELSSAVGFVPNARLKNSEEKLLSASTALLATEKSFESYRDATRTILRDCRCGDRALLDGGIVHHPESSNASGEAERGAEEDDFDLDELGGL